MKSRKGESQIKPGDVFHYLTVLAEVEKSRWGFRQYLCRCKCGVEKVILGQKMREGATKSCGCYAREIHAKSAEPKICRHCGKEFQKKYRMSKMKWEEQLHCSATCAAQARLSGKPRIKKEARTCTKCGRTFHTDDRDICIYCHREAHRGKNSSYTTAPAQQRQWQDPNDTEVAATWLSLFRNDITLTSPVKIYTQGTPEFEAVARQYLCR